MDDDLEPVVVGEVVEHVLETLRPVAAEKGNELLRSGENAVALADRQRLAQCLLNLIGNACKFTEGGRITVEISVEGPVVHLAVHDTGKGISPSDLQRVFQTFAQADEVSGRGTGLGLPLTRALAQGMGGDLSATSVEGEGSTFTLSLPNNGAL